MASVTKNLGQTAGTRSLQSVITAVVIIAALYFGRGLVVPLALALLFSFLLSTPVIWLERHRFPRSAAVGVVLFLAIALSAGLMWLGLAQLAGIVSSLPQYQQNVVHKLQSIRNPAGQGILRIAESLDELKRDLTATQLQSEKKGNPNAVGTPNSDVTPVPVHVVGGDNGVLSSVGFAGASIAQFAAELMAIVVLTLFILLNREHLRNRLLRLSGQGSLVMMTNTIDDAASRVSRYLLSQLVVNGTFGLALFAGLWLIGVPYAALWGVLVAMLRFVPYVGTFIGGLCPFALSLAAFQGWREPALTLVLYGSIELLVSTFVEPWLYATQTGISSVAFLLSAAFWTLLWGPIGLVLSTPLTVCLAVLGRHVRPLEFLYVLLGDEPVLGDEVRFYQRLLADDEDEAVKVLETALKEQSLASVYDGLVIPALTLSEQDRHEGRLAEERASAIYQTAREIIEVAGERHPCDDFKDLVLPSILCLPARDQADEVVGSMLVQMLRQCGAVAELTNDLETPGEGLFVLSALPPFAVIHARTVCKRIRARYPQASILLGVWGSTTPADSIRERLGTACSDWVVTSLAQAMDLLKAVHASEPAADEAVPTIQD